MAQAKSSPNKPLNKPLNKSNGKNLHYHHRAAGRYQLSLWLLGLGIFALLLNLLRLFLPTSGSLAIGLLAIDGWQIYVFMMLAWALLSALGIAIWGRVWARKQALHWLDTTIGLSYRSALEYSGEYSGYNPNEQLEPAIISALQRRASLKVQRLALPQPRAWWLPVWIIAALLFFVPHISLATRGTTVNNRANDNAISRPFNRSVKPPRDSNEEAESNARDDLQAASSSQAEQATLEDFLEAIPERSANISDDETERDSFADAQNDNQKENDNQEGAPRPNAGMNPFAPVESSAQKDSSAQDDAGISNQGAQTDNSVDNSVSNGNSQGNSDTQADDTTANANTDNAASNAASNASSDNAQPPLARDEVQADNQPQAARDIPSTSEGSTPNYETATSDASTSELQTAQSEDSNQSEESNQAASQQNSQQNSQENAQPDAITSEAQAEGENENSQAEASSDPTAAGTQRMAKEEQTITGAEQQGEQVTNAAGVSNDNRAGDGSTGATASARERLGGATGDTELLEASQDSGERIAVGSAKGEQVLRLDEASQQLNNLPSFDDVAKSVVNEGSIPNEYHEVLRRYFR